MLRANCSSVLRSDVQRSGDGRGRRSGAERRPPPASLFQAPHIQSGGSRIGLGRGLDFGQCGRGGVASGLAGRQFVGEHCLVRGQIALESQVDDVQLIQVGFNAGNRVGKA